MKKLTKPQQKQFRPILLAYLKQLGAKLEHLEEAALLIDDDAGPDDGDEFGSESQSRELQLGLIENENQIVEECYRALERIRDNVFGNCGACKEQIPPRRLEVRPYSEYCVGCKEKLEKGELDID
ncbi:MAG: DnaK suppressor protein [Myxococcota bacterium]|jgi:DnaK suppressor protein